MNIKDVNWDWLKSFHSVAEQGSLSAAARELGTTQPTVGRHIDLLEEALGEALFIRSRDGLEPTPEGLALVPYVETMAAAQTAMVRAMSGEDDVVEGTVRLAASEVMGVEILPQMLTRFHRQYPGVSIELVLNNRLEDLMKREADLAVRMVRPTQVALIAKKIGDSPIGLFAHRDYLARHGTPETLSEIQGHIGIGPDEDKQVIEALQKKGLSISDEMFSIRTDNQVAQLALLRAGIGICGAQIHLAKKDKNLVHILQDDFQLSMEVWLVMHEGLKNTRRVRVLFDFLARELAEFLKGN